MDGDDKQKSNAAELLHKKRKLEPLRTYHGDLLSVIKNQKESLTSITVKEKERKEKRDEDEVSPTTTESKSLVSNFFTNKNLPINIFTIILGILLIAGSVTAVLYTLRIFKSEPSSSTQVRSDILNPNQTITLTNVSKNTLVSELAQISGDGITTLEISDTNGQTVQSSKELLKLLEIEPPSGFIRNLESENVIGVHTHESGRSYFLILRVQEFGPAFSGLLEWESSMPKDLFFLNNMSTSSDLYSWKDFILKNKDVRIFANINDIEDIGLIYTFLDKKTILITNSVASLSELSNMYTSRSIVR